MPSLRGHTTGPPPAGMTSRHVTPVQIPHPAVVPRSAPLPLVVDPSEVSSATVLPFVSHVPFRPTRVFPVVRRRFHTASFVEVAPFAFDHRFVFFHHGFGFPSCSSFFGFAFPPRHFFFHGFFNCFPEPFFEPVFFEPFFVPFVPTAEPFLTGAPTVIAGPESGTATRQETNGDASQSDASAFDNSSIEEKGAATEAPPAAAPGAERPLTLLQLREGSMFGLTDYWVEDNRLRYRTSYGGENSVPFEQIDLDKTIELNAERGIEFTLRSKPGWSKP